MPHRYFSLAVAALTAAVLGGAQLTPAAAVYQTGALAPAPQEYPWLYLRDGQARLKEATVELVAVGDINLGRGMSGEPDPFVGSAAWLQAADLAFGNLECAIAGSAGGAVPGYVGAGAPVGGPPGSQPYHLIAPPEAAQALASAGLDLLGLANNHALDAGPDGLSETVAHLDGAGITPVGAGPGGMEAYTPVFRTVRGVRLAFLAFNSVPAMDEAGEGGELSSQPSATLPVPGTWEERARPTSRWEIARWDPELAAAAVRLARQQAHGVIVFIHWGYEYELRPDPAQEAIAQALQAAGADVILGHHPHVAQRGSVLDGLPGAAPAVAAYSLGNFVFDQEFGETRQGLALRLFFDKQGLRAAQLLPVRAGPRPRLLEPGEAAGLWRRVLPRPVPVAYTCGRDTCTRATSLEGVVGSGRFTAGQADLTGDGRPETVRLAGDRVSIYESEEKTWESPPDWQVSDLAIGDPDGDGREDLMLALWKPDGEGVLRSHPFVFGYRGGRYRTIWGGSPVGRPIHEIELGDLDGDGLQELMVLEETPTGLRRTVSVWRWHGWGFSRVWRCAPGDFVNLHFTPGDGEAGAILQFDQEY